MENDKKKEFMEWVPVYEQKNENENPAVIGYRCSNCRFFTNRKYEGCPFCRRRAVKWDE